MRTNRTNCLLLHPLQSSLAIALAIACFVLVTPAMASLSFTNGGFSTSVTLGTGVSFCASSSPTACVSNVTDWTSTCTYTGSGSGCGTGSTVLWVLAPDSNGSEFNNGIGLYSMPAPPDSGNVVADDGDQTGHYEQPFWQTVTGLVIGDTYAVTFYEAAAQQKGTTGATTEQWEVMLGSQIEYGPVMDNSSGGFVAWNEQTLDFVATATSEVLEFIAIGTPAGEPPVVLMSGLSMTQVPEPASFALIGAALVGVSLLYRRKRAR